MCVCVSSIALFDFLLVFGALLVDQGGLLVHWKLNSDGLSHINIIQCGHEHFFLFLTCGSYTHIHAVCTYFI